MMESRFTLISKFSCCGNSMVTVIMNGAACVMYELEYNRIIEEELEFNQKNKLRESA